MAEVKRESKRQKQMRIEADYKRIAEQLQQVGRDEDPEVIQNMVTEHLGKTDELYKHVKKKLTGSAADARHMKNLIQLSTATAKRINTPVRFDVGRALRDLKREHGDQLQNVLMKECVLKCFMAAPTFEFFYGAIKKEGLEIKQRRKRARVSTEDRNVSSARAMERNIATECEQDTTPKEVEAIHAKIKQLTMEGPRREVGLIPTLVDPNSFPQTVENIFHMAFLIKEGKVGVKKGVNNKPVLTYDHSGESQSQPTQRRDKSTQSILSFSMADYNKWVASQR